MQGKRAGGQSVGGEVWRFDRKLALFLEGMLTEVQVCEIGRLSEFQLSILVYYFYMIINKHFVFVTLKIISAFYHLTTNQHPIFSI